MTEPSQYFKGRTVQEQMNEVISYVDVRAEEVAAAKADDVLVPAEQAKTDAIAAKEAAEDAQAAAEQAVTDAAAVLANAVKKTGESSQGIAGDIIVAGNLTGGTVTVPTPVNNTDAANKKYVDDADALKADKTYVDAQDALKINIADINSYAVGLTGNQGPITGIKDFEYVITNNFVLKDTSSPGAGTWRRLFSCAASSTSSNRTVSIMLVGTRVSRIDFINVNYGGLTGTGNSASFFGIFDVRVCRATSGDIEIWTNAGVYAFCIFDGIRTGGKITNCSANLSDNDTTEPVVGADFSAVATPSVVIQ